MMIQSNTHSNKIRITLMIVSLAVLTLVFAGCATKGAKPDDMSVAEHRANAEVLQQKAKYHEGLYRPGYYLHQTYGDFEDLDYNDYTYNPTEVHRDNASQFRAMASDHLKAAKTLENFEKAQCGEFPPATRKLCPLMGTIDHVVDIPGGVQIFFKTDKLPMDAVFDHMKCHNAFGRTVDYKGMSMCPLYLEQISIEKSTDGKSVEITTTDPDTIESIRKRTKAHLTTKFVPHEH